MWLAIDLALLIFNLFCAYLLWPKIGAGFNLFSAGFIVAIVIVMLVERLR